MIDKIGIRYTFKISVPLDVLKIKEVFTKNGHQLFLVGGCIRDTILNVTPKDFDLVTNVSPEEVIRILKHEKFVTTILETGKSFGVINVITSDNEFEIATMRNDVFSDTPNGRHPDRVIFGDIFTDCMRRDYTMNALFYDLDTNEIIDFVNGVNDIEKSLIKAVGNPEERFKEDKLRKLRGVRLAARFGSELDPEIDAALKRDASLEGISGERIRDEFIKGIKSAKSVVKFLEMLDRYHLFNWIFKGLHVNKDFIEDRNVVVLIAILLKGNNIGVIAKQLNNLKYSVDEIKSITFLLSLLHLTPETAVALKRQQKNAYTSNHQIIDFANREGLNTRLIHAFLNFELTVTGEEVMQKFNLKQGKELGDMINKLELDNFKKSL